MASKASTYSKTKEWIETKKTCAIQYYWFSNLLKTYLDTLFRDLLAICSHANAIRWLAQVSAAFESHPFPRRGDVEISWDLLGISCVTHGKPMGKFGWKLPTRFERRLWKIREVKGFFSTENEDLVNICARWGLQMLCLLMNFHPSNYSYFIKN